MAEEFAAGPLQHGSANQSRTSQDAGKPGGKPGQAMAEEFAAGPLQHGSANQSSEHLLMGQKHEYVHRWLEGVFVGEGIPDYEINSQTVELLYQMARENEAREKEAEVVIADLEQKTREYAVETTRVQSVLEWMNFQLTDLSPSAQGYVKSLAGVATALEAKDTSDTSLLLALTELSQRQAALRVEEAKLDRELEHVQEDTSRAIARRNRHKQTLNELSGQTKALASSLAKQKKDSEFLGQKIRQYQKLVETMKEELEHCGYDSSLSHTALQQSAQEIEELQRQLAPLKSQLDSYQDLPPDLELAKVKVEEAKRELARLEAEIARTIDLVHAEK